MGKQILVLLYNGVLPGIKNKRATDLHNNTINLRSVMQSKRSQTQKSIFGIMPFI